MNKTLIHPILVHLPIGGWTAALILDLVYSANHNPLVAGGAFSCIFIGLVGALLAAPFGLKDYLETRSRGAVRKLATTHFLLNLSVVILYAINLYSRFEQRQGFPTVITSSQVALSVFSVLILALSGVVGIRLASQLGTEIYSGESRPQPGTDFKRAA